MPISSNRKKGLKGDEVKRIDGECRLARQDFSCLLLEFFSFVNERLCASTVASRAVFRLCG